MNEKLLRLWKAWKYSPFHRKLNWFLMRIWLLLRKLWNNRRAYWRTTRKFLWKLLWRILLFLRKHLVPWMRSGWRKLLTLCYNRSK